MTRSRCLLRSASIAAVALAAVLFAGGLSQPATADVSFSFFYSNLSPYGTWGVSAEHGRVWRPYDYEPGWNPYYDGHWVYTDYGWAWVSDYRWGAIPYHYGTWVTDPHLGWVWIPGYVWAPSWVVFCSGHDYVGWAPVPPRYVVGASVRFDDIGADRFIFVPTRSFTASRLRPYVVPRHRTGLTFAETRIINNITVQNNIVVNRGLDPRGIEKVAGKSIRPVPVERVQKIAPGNRFDAQQVQVDRSEHGNRPRATAPEPAKRPEKAERPESARMPEPSVRQGGRERAKPRGSSIESVSRPRPSGGPEGQRERAREAAPREQAREAKPREQAREAKPREKPPNKSDRPPKPKEPPKPEKPPKNGQGGHQ